MTHAVFVPARAKVLESGTVYSKTLQDYVTDSSLCVGGLHSALTRLSYERSPRKYNDFEDSKNSLVR